MLGQDRQMIFKESDESGTAIEGVYYVKRMGGSDLGTIATIYLYKYMPWANEEQCKVYSCWDKE